MALNRKNIDRRTNKPDLDYTKSNIQPDQVLNRSKQVRRDDDVIRTPKRSIYDVDYAIKTYIEQEIQPTIIDNETIISVPVIFAHGEKWDNVRRLGYMRDEKGMLQSPAIMIKRSSFSERDNFKTLDVNINPDSNLIVHKNKYNPRNRYEDTLFPFPIGELNQQESLPAYIVNIPKYITVEYELMIWTDFSTQLNELVNNLFTYNRFAWGEGINSYNTTMGTISFETVNTVSEDRLVRATIPLTVQATLQSEQETRVNTIKKMYSVKKLSFDMVIDVSNNIFESTIVPARLLQQYSSIMSGNKVVVSNLSTGGTTSINAEAITYLTQLTDKIATYSNATTATVTGTPARNPVTGTVATINEFDLYINGQYIDKAAYVFTPNINSSTQTITFNTTELGYNIEAEDLIVINGRWA
jgi:hypothetical protein